MLDLGLGTDREEEEDRNMWRLSPVQAERSYYFHSLHLTVNALVVRLNIVDQNLLGVFAHLKFLLSFLYLRVTNHCQQYFFRPAEW